MKIYVSGSFSEQARLRKESQRLIDLGHAVTGSWLYEQKQPAFYSHGEWMKNLGMKDWTQLMSADCIICDTTGKSTTGGRYVEWGMALGQHNMLKITVGDMYGVFFPLGDRHFETWDDMISDLLKWPK